MACCCLPARFPALTMTPHNPLNQVPIHLSAPSPACLAATGSLSCGSYLHASRPPGLCSCWLFCLKHLSPTQPSSMADPMEEELKKQNLLLWTGSLNADIPSSPWPSSLLRCLCCASPAPRSPAVYPMSRSPRYPLQLAQRLVVHSRGSRKVC